MSSNKITLRITMRNGDISFLDFVNRPIPRVGEVVNSKKPVGDTMKIISRNYRVDEVHYSFDSPQDVMLFVTER